MRETVFKPTFIYATGKGEYRLALPPSRMTPVPFDSPAGVVVTARPEQRNEFSRGTGCDHSRRETPLQLAGRMTERYVDAR